MENKFIKFVIGAIAVVGGFFAISYLFGTVKDSNVSFFRGESGGYSSEPSTINSSRNNQTSSGGSATARPRTASPYRISISTGNASSEDQPQQEYIILKNTSSSDLDITGWTLKNSKGDRPANVVQNTLVYERPDEAVIPQGTLFLDPDGNSFMGNIVLKPQESAYIVTGRPYRVAPVSFKENICTGYLKSERYTFKPALESKCPLLRDDPATAYLPEACYDYVKTISRCEDPELTEEERFELQKQSCQDFIEARVGYENCTALHGLEEEFFGTRWRIYLGRNFEMWGRDDAIRIYDRAGNLVMEKKY